LVDKIRSAVQFNIFVSDISRFIKSKGHDKLLTEFQAECSNLDIFSCDEIIEINKRVHFYRKDNEVLAFSREFRESLHYGHLHSFFEYSGIDLTDAIFFPIIEHGTYFEPKEYIQRRGSVVVMGQNRQSFWHMFCPGKPAFVVGPYIHYATPYYDDERHTYLKKQWGRMLLVFPHHTFEMVSAEYDVEKFVNDVMKVHAKHYDTVVVCLYWADVSTKLYEAFRAHGAEIVCAGYRWDYNFIKRLKTIISLADSVITNSIGTHIGYCGYMEKAVKYIESNAAMTYKGEKFEGSTEPSAIPSIKSILLQEKGVEEQKTLFEQYWGFNEVKTKEEIRGIFDLNKKIIWMSKGNYSKFGKSAQKLLMTDLSAIKRKLLSDAVSVQGDNSF